jgi:bifunctional DNA-binding transcriptional regulator/antitoxin component of YhaV-PrlF toxin-antitoxin module
MYLNKEELIELIIDSNGQIIISANYSKSWGLKPNSKIRVKIYGKDKNITIQEIIKDDLDDLPSIIGKTKFISDEKIDESLKNAISNID